MIYTCTLNPAIDLFIDTDDMKSGQVNRTNYSEILPNGKGVNVSFILKMLGIDSIALGVGGGFTNSFIEKSLAEKEIPSQFIHTAEPTRINVFARVHEGNKEYKLVNKGPEVTKKQLQELLDKLEQLISNDTLIISGSFAQGIPSKTLVDIAKLSSSHGFRLIIDVSSSVVLDSLAYRPFLIKPNEDELKEWFGVKKPLKLSETIVYLKQLLKRGAQNILLSLGSEGAVFINERECLFGNAPKGLVVNTACSGDAMLGSFVAGLEQGKNISENLKFSIGAGSSTAFTSGLTDFKDVSYLCQQITITSQNN